MKTLAVLYWGAVVLALCSIVCGKLTVCPVNKLQFISYNITLLPRNNVQASSENTLSNPLDHFIQPNAGPWCSDYNDVDNPNLHINFTFTEPVVITFLQSSGFFNVYVASFSLQYALGAEGETFMPYGVLQVPQVFHVNEEVHQHQGAYFTMERPLVAERLKLKIHNSVFDKGNRSCWDLKVLGCTFREAMTIEEPGDGLDTDPCPITDGGMMMINTAYPEPTDLPSEPCIMSLASNNDTQVSTERMLTVLVPVAVGVVVLCAVIVGGGVFGCYTIVAKKSKDTDGKSKYHKGVTVKVLGRKHIPVPKEPGNAQKAMQQDNMFSQRGSICSNDTDSFHYDMPRPITYDVPRSSSQRHRSGTISSNEYRNPIYDGTSSKESNPYESIPYDLDKRSRNASENLPKSETRTRRASDMLPCSGQDDPASMKQEVQHSSDPQMTQYSVVDKSKKTKERGIPVFEVLYDMSAAASKDDIDTPINLTDP